MDAFYGEIRLMAIQYTPMGWLPCDGRQLNTVEYQALYAVIGNIYGGTAPTTFNLPDLRAAVAVGTGNDPQDAFDPVLASKGGANSVILTTTTLPPHQHTLTAATGTPGTRVAEAQGNWVSAAVYLPTAPPNESAYTFVPTTGNPAMVNLNQSSLSTYAGQSQAHENRQPYLALQYFICVGDGVFPVHD